MAASAEGEVWVEYAESTLNVGGPPSRKSGHRKGEMADLQFGHSGIRKSFRRITGSSDMLVKSQEPFTPPGWGFFLPRIAGRAPRRHVFWKRVTPKWDGDPKEELFYFQM